MCLQDFNHAKPFQANFTFIYCKLTETKLTGIVANVVVNVDVSRVLSGEHVRVPHGAVLGVVQHVVQRVWFHVLEFCHHLESRIMGDQYRNTKQLKTLDLEARRSKIFSLR